MARLSLIWPINQPIYIGKTGGRRHPDLTHDGDMEMGKNAPCERRHDFFESCGSTEIMRIRRLGEKFVRQTAAASTRSIGVF